MARPRSCLLPSFVWSHRRMRLWAIIGDYGEGHDAPIRRWSSRYLHASPCGSRRLSDHCGDARSRRRSHVPGQKPSRRARACRKRRRSGQIRWIFAARNSKAALSPRDHTPCGARSAPGVSLKRSLEGLSASSEPLGGFFCSAAPQRRARQGGLPRRGLRLSCQMLGAFRYTGKPENRIHGHL